MEYRHKICVRRDSLGIPISKHPKQTKMKLHTKALIVAATFGAFIASAHATVMFNISRTSDTQVSITGSGTLDSVSSSNGHIIGFDDIFGTAPTPPYDNVSVFVSSTLGFTSSPISYFAYDTGTGYGAYSPGTASIYAGFAPLSSGVSLNGGTLFLDLANTPGATFAAVGDTGNVYSGIFGGVLVGTWTMTGASSVPDSGTTIALLGLALSGIAMMRRKLNQS